MNQNKLQHEYYFVNNDPIKTMEKIRNQRQDIIEANKIEDKVERGAALFCEEELLYYGEVGELVNHFGLNITNKPSEYNIVQLISESGCCMVFSNNKNPRFLEPHYSWTMLGGSLEKKDPQWEIAKIYLKKYAPSLTIAHDSLTEIVTNAYESCEKSLKEFLADLKG